MKRRLLLGLMIMIALVFGVMDRHKSWAQSENTRVITVHAEGETKTVATNAATVKDALDRLGITLSQNDKTEPGLNQKIEGNDYTINVYRARPVAVVDGANIYSVLTAQRSGRAIAKEAGFSTDQEDQFDFEKADTQDTSTPGTRMVIKRSKNITFSLYGTASPLKTHENTVGALLKERNLKLEQGDETNVPLATKISEGMTVSVDKVNRNSETVEEVAQFPTQQIQDVNQPTTYKQIKTPGQNGKKLVTYELVSRNGQPAIRVAVKEVITIQPVTEVMVVGARPFNANVSAEKISIMAAAGIAPTDYDYVDHIVSRESGWRVNASNGKTWGLCQALPGSKMSSAGADWQTNPVTQMKWCNGYAVGRYGSWSAAYSFWSGHHWW